MVGCSKDNSLHIENIDKGSNNIDKKQENSSHIYVHIVGEVKKPGVYKVDEGDRVFDVVKKAGGFTSLALEDSVNMARLVKDAEQIVVPNKNLAKASDGKINVNQADMKELTSISGIGPAKAKAILNYRKENGRFNSIDELTKVKGISKKFVDNIREAIEVK